MAVNDRMSEAATAASAQFTRRNLFRYASLAGAGILAGPALAACAGPTAAPGTSAAATTAASVAASGAAPSGAGAATGVVNIALNRNLISLDNKLNQFDAAVTVQRAVRQALTKIGEKLTPELVLAESFEATSPTEWTVKLRSDIKYSDGTPVTVEDVETALKLYFQVPAGYVAAQFTEQPTFKKIDDKSFTLSTKAPVVTLDSLMSNILITPAAANKAEELQSGVGTGPFVVSSADSGTGTYKLTPNPNYWGPDKAQAAEVNVSYNEDESSRVIALETGQLDVIDTITPESAAHLKEKDTIEVVETPGTRLIHLFYNFRLPKDHPISNPKVREALSYAVDSATLISTLMDGQVSNAEGVVPKTLAGFKNTGTYSFDPEKAKTMLAAEGVSGLNLVMIWEESEFAGAAQVMEALVTMLGDVGVTLKLTQIPKGGEIAAWRSGDKSGDWHILGNGYGNQTGLALTNLVGQYAGTAEKEAKKESYHGFVVPAITDLITKAGSEPDEAKRNELLGQAQEKIWAEWPAMWAWTPNNVLAKSKKVTGLNLLAINSYDLSAVTVSG